MRKTLFALLLAVLCCCQFASAQTTAAADTIRYSHYFYMKVKADVRMMVDRLAW